MPSPVGFQFLQITYLGDVSIDDFGDLWYFHSIFLHFAYLTCDFAFVKHLSVFIVFKS